MDLRGLGSEGLLEKKGGMMLLCYLPVVSVSRYTHWVGGGRASGPPRGKYCLAVSGILTDQSMATQVYHGDQGCILTVLAYAIFGQSCISLCEVPLVRTLSTILHSHG